MFNFLYRKNKKQNKSHEASWSSTNFDWKTDAFITTDIHSHLLPAIDDGSQSLEESLELIKELQKLGYKKIITTPHVISDFYKNTPEVIESKLAELQAFLTENQIDIKISAAAEYYLDDWFMRKIENNEKMLTFGKKYLLFETGFLNKPQGFFHQIFKIQAAGYIPVFAHPERYTYLYNDFDIIDKLVERDVLLQINATSLTGYYGKPAQLFAEKLIELGLVSFVGSDCHGKRHIKAMQGLKERKFYHQLYNLPIKNNDL